MFQEILSGFTQQFIWQPGTPMFLGMLTGACVVCFAWCAIKGINMIRNKQIEIWTCILLVISLLACPFLYITGSNLEGARNTQIFYAWVIMSSGVISILSLFIYLIVLAFTNGRAETITEDHYVKNEGISFVDEGNDSYRRTTNALQNNRPVTQPNMQQQQMPQQRPMQQQMPQQGYPQNYRQNPAQPNMQQQRPMQQPQQGYGYPQQGRQMPQGNQYQQQQPYPQNRNTQGFGQQQPQNQRPVNQGNRTQPQSRGTGYMGGTNSNQYIADQLNNRR